MIIGITNSTMTLTFMNTGPMSIWLTFIVMPLPMATCMLWRSKYQSSV